MKSSGVKSQNNLVLPEMAETPVAAVWLVHRAVKFSVLIVSVALVAALITSFAVKITMTVSANGTLEPSSLRLVHSPESGIIDRVFVNPGDTVRRGQLVIQLDSTTIKNNLRDLLVDCAVKQSEYNRMQMGLLVDERDRTELAIQTSARLLRAKANFRKSLADYQIRGEPDSVQRIYKVGQHIGLNLAYADVLAAEADTRSAENKKQSLTLERLQLHERLLSLGQLRAQIASLQARMNRLKVTSPLSGIVTTEQLDRLPGTYVREGELLFQVTDLERWYAALFISEKDLHEIRTGSEANIEVPALYSLHPGMLQGVVRSIASEPFPSGQPTSNAIPNRYRVVVELRQKDIAALDASRLKVGYAVIGKIVTGGGSIYWMLWNSLTRRNSYDEP